MSAEAFSIWRENRTVEGPDLVEFGLRARDAEVEAAKANVTAAGRYTLRLKTRLEAEVERLKEMYAYEGRRALVLQEYNSKLQSELEEMKRVDDSVVASCNCRTKTPMIKHHEPGCKYWLISERDAFRVEAADLKERLEFASQGWRNQEQIANEGWATQEAASKREDAAIDRCAELEEVLRNLMHDVQEWCDAVDKDASWDGWDHHYKKLRYCGLDTYRKALTQE